VMAAVPGASVRRTCSRLGVPRSAMGCRPRKGRHPVVDAERAARAWQLIEQHPTFGYRRVWAMMRFKDGLRINKKAVYRILKLNGWFVHQRQPKAKPRVRGRRSIAPSSDMRWATDVTHIPAGADGWAHLAVVIDCHDREIIGYELALRGRAKEAERALEDACLRRFGTLRPEGPKPVLRSDNA